MVSGRSFHSCGAATAKARSPLDTSLDRGTFRSLLVPDLSGFELEAYSRRSVMYCGARPLRALKTNMSVLNLTLYLTGSQCRDAVQ